MYINKPLKEYLDDLAAKRAAPGGGSASALAAATGTSLMSMVANFTLGKEGYKDAEDKIADILLETTKLDSELRALIDKDVDAYMKLSTALKGAAGDGAKLEDLYKDAAEVPFMVCKITNKCIKLCRGLAEYGNRNLVTDTATAAILFEAAFFSAKFHVYINLKYIKDMDYISNIHDLLAALEEEMPGLKEEILEMCEDAISS
ncbi:MAG: cyclodeaminase/cyclohydrolase family protein [Candidatus Omnitrophica bacterium]|nr:cyclodeaminase/cyclohydrolase family protein [Candidatus Omnitrophota bacterium]